MLYGWRTKETKTKADDNGTSNSKNNNNRKAINNTLQN